MAVVYDTLFSLPPTTKTMIKTDIDKSSCPVVNKPLDFRTCAQVTKIEYEMDKRNKTLKRPVKRTYDANIIRGTEERDTLLDAEINKHLEVKKWKDLDLSFKWKFCKEYINSLSIKKKVTAQKYVKEALLAGQLIGVEYCIESNSITCLNITLADGVVI